MEKLFVGLMSGTSVDSIDSVLLDLSNNKIQILEENTTEIKKGLKSKILNAVNKNNLSDEEIKELDFELGLNFGMAVLNLLNKSSLDISEVSAIGSHGQTIKHSPHLPDPISLQIGDPKEISKLTGIKTVANFRKADIKAGGEGAPLAPLFHQFILRLNALSSAVIINIGGISNITKLTDLGKKVIAFDCGPGNCLMDAWSREHGKGNFDEKGKWASSGKLLPELFEEMINDSFFKTLPPKSTGTDYFNLDWIKNKTVHLKSPPSSEDVQATLTELTAKSIFLELENLDALNEKVYICGGGIHNNLLINKLENLIKNKTFSTSSLGFSPDFLEACCFGWLAQQRLKGNKFDLSTITGSKGKVMLGEIWEPH